MNSARLLKIIFVILLLVTAGELVYYLYIQFSIRKDVVKDDTSFARTQINIPTLILESSPVEKKTQEIILPSTVPNSDLAIDIETAKAILLKDLIKTSKDVLISSTVTNQYQGEIVKLNTKGGIANNFAYKIELIIQGDKIKKGFLYNEYDLSILKISTASNEEEKLININDLKVGDKVNIFEAIDLTKSCLDDKCIKEIKIFKI